MFRRKSFVNTKEKMQCNDKRYNIIWNVKGIISTALTTIAIIYFLTVGENKFIRILKDNFLIVILVLYIMLMYIVNCFRSERLSQFIDKVQKKGTINTLLTSIVLVSMVTTSMTVQSNEIAKQQVEIEDRETAPLLSIKPYRDGYEIVNEKGMASYVTFNSYERYNFQYKGEAYEISLVAIYREQNNQYNLNSDNSRLIFEPKTAVFNKDIAFENLKNYVSEKTGEDIVVSNTRELELGFYDYLNQEHRFYYNEYEEKISLISTDRNTVPTNNITVAIWNVEQLEAQIKYAIDYLIQS